MLVSKARLSSRPSQRFLFLRRAFVRRDEGQTLIARLAADYRRESAKSVAVLFLTEISTYCIMQPVA